jgi:DNA invertase Pin-like site-specific DNA recombinase
MNIGYARISTGEQSLDLQLDALTQAGCTSIYQDEISGTKSDRPGLQQALNYLRAGDTLVVWRLDRLGRSLKDLVSRVESLEQRGVGFRSLTEAIDTTTSAGRFQFHVFGALAQFERDLIHERTMAGLRAARARGRVGGRRKSLTPAQVKMASSLMQNLDLSIDDIIKTLGCSRTTLYRYVGPRGEIRQR